MVKILYKYNIRTSIRKLVSHNEYTENTRNFKFLFSTLVIIPILTKEINFNQTNI